MQRHRRDLREFQRCIALVDNNVSKSLIGIQVCRPIHVMEVNKMNFTLKYQKKQKRMNTYIQHYIDIPAFDGT